MKALAVFISYSGKTVELEVGPNVRVEAVQQTLAELTGIPQSDQILMCEGTRLDAAKPLLAYGLPGGEHEDKVHDLFLYSRAHLRPDAPLPPPEALPDCPVNLSGLESIRQQRHRLDSAGSPLLRALPDYQRQFQEHLLQANARHEASQQRIATCARLVSEQEVQALSIDAACANVEVHYAYICDAYSAFMRRYQAEHAAHAEVLSRFEGDLAYLASTELHPALRGTAIASAGSSASGSGIASGSAGGSSGSGDATHLIHLVNAEQLREAAAACTRGHQHFGTKVTELESLFGMLKADVEALFMQAPSVDLEALTRQLEEMHTRMDEQASIVAALSSDLNKVQQLVEQASEQLSAADPVASVQVSDTVHMLETMHETHVSHLIPRVIACHAAVEGFAAQCLDCKNALTRDVFAQLRTISSQQSKIREMKNKLALFREALARQEGAVQELLVVRRVPAAYKQCLAECVRRGAFMEKYAHSAAQLAERMGTFREKELAMRDSFRKHVERLIPAQLLDRMGLLEQPPHCQVSVSAAEEERLLSVTVDDVRRIQLPWGSTSVLTAPRPPAPPAAAAGGGGSREGSAPPTPAAGSMAATPEQQQQAEEAAAAAVAEADVTASLQLENAKLRAELASQIALDCIRSAQLAVVGGLAGTTSAAAAASPAGSAVAGGSGQASPQMGLSALGSPAGAAAGGGSMPAAVAAAVAAAAAPLPPDALQRFERALAAKDGLVTELKSQLASSRQQTAAYEARIQQLETQLTALSASIEGRAPLAAGLGSQTAAAGGGGSGSGSGSKAGSPSTGTAAAGTGIGVTPMGQDAVAGATAAAAPLLSASVDAAAGSSLSGCLPDSHTSRSLGATSSSSSAAALQHSQHAQQQQQGQQQQEDQQQQSPSTLPEQAVPLLASVSERGPAAASEEVVGSPVAPSQIDATAEQAPAPTDSPAPEQPAASVPATSDAGSVHKAAAPPLSSSAASQQQPEAVAVTISAPQAEPDFAGPAQAAAAAGDGAATEEAGADAAAAAASGDAASGGDLAASSGDAAAAAMAAAPPPHGLPPPEPPMLASMVVDEGSDVEGVEPVTDSEAESDDTPPGTGYDSACSAEQEQPSPTAAEAPPAGSAAAEVEDEEVQEAGRQQEEEEAAAAPQAAPEEEQEQQP